MRTWLRQHRYALGVTLRRLALQPFSTATNVLVIALMLALPLVGSAFISSLQPLLRELPTEPQVSVFLKPQISQADSENVQNRLREEAAKGGFEMRWIPRDAALAELQTDSTWADSLAVLDSNPLPDAATLTFQGADATERALASAERWRDWPETDVVQLDSDWLHRLQSLSTLITTGLLLLSIVVGGIVLATVFNTVRMQALAHREEIAVARLVGATEPFVRRPFLYQGGLTALLAAVLAIVFSTLAVGVLNRRLTEFLVGWDTQLLFQLPHPAVLLGFLVGASAVGALSARWSVSRHTRF